MSTRNKFLIKTKKIRYKHLTITIIPCGCFKHDKDAETFKVNTKKLKIKYLKGNTIWHVGDPKKVPILSLIRNKKGIKIKGHRKTTKK